MVVPWLIEGGVGPALVAWPVNWAAEALANAAQRWFRRLRRTDDLSRLVSAATGTSIDLTTAEFDALRRLLEDQQTWRLVGQGTVDELATQIASCLPSRDGRTSEDSWVAALTIARGLLEFAVADLDPKLFQQLLLTRLQRLETDQASALDRALFSLHADLLASLAAQGELDAQHFSRMMWHLRRVLDLLPPGPARRGEIVAYLRTLIDWLSIDPWPHDLRFSGPMLNPAAIERKLRVTATAQALEKDLDADKLAQQCQRLVILGGPGAGKTWLAKRTARRCAEAALAALAAGGAIDEVELPLYTTCSRLYSAHGDIRDAAVSSALDQLGDLGGSRLTAAIRVFFTERNAPTLLVIDSLDEAHGSDDRLRQADTLPWRIVLTTRPSSWNHQLIIEEANDSHRTGELQPLCYPDDVEPFIKRWFAERPEWGDVLAAQIASRPSLQEAVAVPLILAFYCIVGGSEPLPDFRHDLYTRVVKRMLTGRWRGGQDARIDVDTCLRTLRAWAWSGAINNPISGIGAWVDDIITGPCMLSGPDEDALDHVATPLGPANVDTGFTSRRFIHRSIREHLVAEYVGSLSVGDAVEAILPHLWYDPDWEHVVPAALAMHPEHDRLLRDLICRISSSDQLPGHLSVIDVGWESRKLIARVTFESSNADWSPEVADMIGQARLELARSANINDLGGAVSWATSNRRARRALLELLESHTDRWTAERLVHGIIQLSAGEEDKRQARQALLELLDGHTDGWTAEQLVHGIIQLSAGEEDKRQARQALLELLDGHTDGWTAEQLVHGVVQLYPVDKDKKRVCKALLRLLDDQIDRWTAEQLVREVVLLDPADEDKKRVCTALLGLLAGQTDGSVAEQLVSGVVQLSPAQEDQRRAREALLAMLAGQTDSSVAEQLVGGVVQLSPAQEDQRRAREALLATLDSRTDPWVAWWLVSGVVRLSPADEDKKRVCTALLGLLAGQTDSSVAEQLVGGVVQLSPAQEDQRRAREALLAMLAGQIDSSVAEQLVGGVVRLSAADEDKKRVCTALLGLLAGQTDGSVAEQLVGGVVQLSPAQEDQRRACATLLAMLAGQTDGWVAERLVGRVVQLDPAAEDKRRARAALLAMLAGQTDGWVAERLVGRVVQLDPTAEDKRRARAALLTILGSHTDGRMTAGLVAGVVQLSEEQDKRRAREALLRLLGSHTDPWVALRLVGGMVQLDPTAEDKRRARAALLAMLAGQTNWRMAAGLVGELVQLSGAVEERHRVREALLRLLAGQTDGWVAERLVGGIVQLSGTEEEKRQVRKALLGLLAGHTDGWMAAGLADGVAQLDPTAEDKRRAREALLELLVGQTDGWVAERLVGRIVRLNPTVHDLSAWHAWAAQPTVELLAAVRSNSALADWLARLHSLTPLSV